MSAKLDEDKRLIARAIEIGLSIEFLCRLLDYSEVEARQFVGKWMPDKLTAFNALPQTDGDAAKLRPMQQPGSAAPMRAPSRPATSGRTWRRSYHRRQQQTSKRGPPSGRLSVLDEDEKRLFLFMTGRLQFSEQERPYNLLQPDEQEIVREQVERIMRLRT